MRPRSSFNSTSKRAARFWASSDISLADFKCDSISECFSVNASWLAKASRSCASRPAACCEVRSRSSFNSTSKSSARFWASSDIAVADFICSSMSECFSVSARWVAKESRSCVARPVASCGMRSRSSFNSASKRSARFWASSVIALADFSCNSMSECFSLNASWSAKASRSSASRTVVCCEARTRSSFNSTSKRSAFFWASWHIVIALSSCDSSLECFCVCSSRVAKASRSCASRLSFSLASFFLDSIISWHFFCQLSPLSSATF
mmetsp:Transcript_1663/g.4042  ORF Transcript_1663/g.4042 Transcript_1663/m.4042 type:complete len:265 (+) Transcript_1663:1486-2280(+)